MNKQYYVYIVSNFKRSVLYIGVTEDLIKRIWQHKSGLVDGFTKRYKVHDLMYYEVFTDPIEAIAREKYLKNWHRGWKIDLIKTRNPEMIDLYPSLI